MNDWEVVVPRMRFEIWPGPYKELAPADVSQTEFSIRVEKPMHGNETIGGLNITHSSKPILHRFGGRCTLAEIWEALAEYRS